jgi:hypothetical protein
MITTKGVMLMDRSLIDRYAADADVPLRAIAGLSREDLLAVPVPGKWSIQQLIVHLMDSHVTAACRMRKIIAEDNPLITAYDESRFAARLCYETTDAQTAGEIFRLVQGMMAGVLRQLPDEAFQRTGVHTETGEVVLASMVRGCIEHLEHHMMFLREKRTALGKQLTW